MTSNDPSQPNTPQISPPLHTRKPKASARPVKTRIRINNTTYIIDMYMLDKRMCSGMVIWPTSDVNVGMVGRGVYTERKWGRAMATSYIRYAYDGLNLQKTRERISDPLQLRSELFRRVDKERYSQPSNRKQHKSRQDPSSQRHHVCRVVN